MYVANLKVLLFQTGEVKSCVDDEDDRWVS